VVAVADVWTRGRSWPVSGYGRADPCMRPLQAPVGHDAENLCENLEFFGCAPRRWYGGRFSGPSRAGCTRYPRLSATTRLRSSNPWPRPVHAVVLPGDLAGKNRSPSLGAGTIGCFTLVAARHAGAGKIVSNRHTLAASETSLGAGCCARCRTPSRRPSPGSAGASWAKARRCF